MYQLSERLADNIWEIVKRWESLPIDTVGKQMIRSADSVGANIALCIGRGTNKENKRFIRIARGSLYETQHWLRRSYHRKLLTTEQIESLKSIIDNLAPQLNSYLKSIPDSND
ncbi:four helix bundle protein [Calothrix sp. CCY 0018]|uniref:four helix bundle protein n=1 Tax=Calothrix sp. CCY 0018 TaxID=3103864 RepID=UPI0039C6120C